MGNGLFLLLGVLGFTHVLALVGILIVEIRRRAYAVAALLVGSYLVILAALLVPAPSDGSTRLASQLVAFVAALFPLVYGGFRSIQAPKENRPLYRALALTTIFAVGVVVAAVFVVGKALGDTFRNFH